MSLMGMMGESWLNSVEGNERKTNMCPPKCIMSKEKCPECEAKQKQVLAAISELAELEQKIEQVRSNPEVLEQKSITKCSLCGAPFEKGARECPYCDTPYPIDAIWGEIPKSKVEQEQLLMVTAETTYKLYTEAEMFKLKEISSGKKGGLLSMLTGGVVDMTGNLMQMNGTQIKQMAEHYGVGYSEYLLGITTGIYKCLGQLQLNEAQKRQQEQHQRQMQANQQYNDRMRQIQAERAQIMSRQVSRAPRYIGGAGQLGYCCGNCIHYMVHDNECAYNKFRHPSGASDYCNDHRSR